MKPLKSFFKNMYFSPMVYLTLKVVHTSMEQNNNLEESNDSSKINNTVLSHHTAYTNETSRYSNTTTKLGFDYEDLILDHDISCYNVSIKDDLSYADGDDFVLAQGSIFFIESSCKRTLDARQACSVESAAKANPEKSVIVLFAGPVPRKNLAQPTIKSLQKYKNIHFYRLRVEKYLNGTLLDVLVNQIYNGSFSAVHHMANILRYLTLYKFGGIYLDLDMIIMKSFDTLTDNWIVAESNIYEEIGAGAMSVSRNKFGRRFIRKTIRNLKDNPSLWSWRHSSNDVVERALIQTCGDFFLVMKNKPFWCGGVIVYDEKLFYPIDYPNIRNLFGNSTDLSDISQSYGLHFYNALTKNIEITRHSKLARVMNIFCPNIAVSTNLSINISAEDIERYHRLMLKRSYKEDTGFIPVNESKEVDKTYSYEDVSILEY